MKRKLELKGISYSDRTVNEDILYQIFTEVIIEDLRKESKINQRRKFNTSNLDK